MRFLSIFMVCIPDIQWMKATSAELSAMTNTAIYQSSANSLHPTLREVIKRRYALGNSEISDSGGICGFGKTEA